MRLVSRVYPAYIEIDKSGWKTKIDLFDAPDAAYIIFAVGGVITAFTFLFFVLQLRRMSGENASEAVKTYFRYKMRLILAGVVLFLIVGAVVIALAPRFLPPPGPPSPEERKAIVGVQTFIGADIVRCDTNVEYRDLNIPDYLGGFLYKGPGAKMRALTRIPVGVDNLPDYVEQYSSIAQTSPTSYKMTIVLPNPEVISRYGILVKSTQARLSLEGLTSGGRRAMDAASAACAGTSKTTEIDCGGILLGIACGLKFPDPGVVDKLEERAKSQALEKAKKTDDKGESELSRAQAVSRQSLVRMIEGMYGPLIERFEYSGYTFKVVVRFRPKAEMPLKPPTQIRNTPGQKKPPEKDGVQIDLGFLNFTD